MTALRFLDILGFVVGLVYLWLEYKASIWLWLASIIMPAIDMVLYFKAGLYADFGMAIYYCLAGVYGWMSWKYFKDASAQKAERGERPVTRYKRAHILPSLAALPYLIEGVFEYGADADRDWLHDKLREIYGRMIAAGDTTWWEDAKGREYAGGRGSLCHGWSAAPAFYEARYILGVTPLEPGYRRFRFKPFAPCGLARASGTVATPFGPISVSWNRGTNGIESHLDAPADCQPE